MIKAIIFDMDGVIVDSELLWGKAVAEQNKIFGFTPAQDRIYKKFITTHLRGRSQREGIPLYKKKFKINRSYDSIFNERLKILFKIFDRELKLMPGVVPLIKKPYKHYPLLLASSSPCLTINYVLKRFRLKKYFKFILTGDNFKKSKPHPEIYLKSARLLKIKPANILVFEDSIAGVLSAHRAGMSCIAVKQSYTRYKDLHKATFVVKSLREVNLKTIRNL